MATINNDSGSNAAAPPQPHNQQQQQRRWRPSSPHPAHRRQEGWSDVPPLTSFVPAMFVEAEEDFTQPPPSQPADATTRLEQALAGTEQHSRAVQRNMWGMVVREKKRLEQEAQQRLLDAPPERRSERLSIVSALAEDALHENLQAPAYLLPLPGSRPREGSGEGRAPQEERERAYEKERFRFLNEGDVSRFEVPIITRQDLQVRHPAPDRLPPREYVKVRSLDVVQMAMNNLEGYAEQLPRVLEAKRNRAAEEVARNLTALAPNRAAEEEEGGSGGGDPMDIDND